MSEEKPDPFAAMSERIKHNAGSSFGGAYVIVPPGDGSNLAQPLEVLVLDTRQNAAQFFGMLQTQIQMILQEIDAAERRAQFGGR